MKFALINTIQHDLPNAQTAAAREFASSMALSMHKDLIELSYLPNDLSDFADDNSVDMLFFLCQNNRKSVQQLLNQSRYLRLPYIFLTDTMHIDSHIEQLLLPITMLSEEVHKAQIAADIARHSKTDIFILQAKDYGSAAKTNVQKVLTLLDKFSLNAKVELGVKDSFKLYKQIPELSLDIKTNRLILLTASRDYGLDDILFGPPERYVILNSRQPVLVINPRGDLYSLCD